MDKIRLLALKALVSIERGKKYTNIEVDSQIEKNNLSKQNSAFFTSLVYGTVERKLTYDYIISLYSDRKPDKIDIEVLFILRMGIYQILYTDKIPDHSAVDESVRLCRAIKKSSATGFVNAILRKVCRNKNSIPFPDRGGDFVSYLSIFFSVERHICERFISSYGRQKAESILFSYERPSPVTLRVNTLKTTPEELLTSLPDAVIPEKTEYALAIQSLPLDCIKKGLAFVQDLSSQKCVSLLDPRPGEAILDACACPGGKSFAMAMLMHNNGVIISADLHKNKLSLIEKGAELLGIDIISVREMNASVFHADFENKFERVLCDVPCSGLGVIGKKPDLRYKSESDISKLPEIQYGILKNCSSYVKEGGRLMYSTCTLNRDENERVVERFLCEVNSFELEKEETLFPDEGDYDGFFLALMKRTKS